MVLAHFNEKQFGQAGKPIWFQNMPCLFMEIKYTYWLDDALVSLSCNADQK